MLINNPPFGCTHLRVWIVVKLPEMKVTNKPSLYRSETEPKHGEEKEEEATLEKRLFFLQGRRLSSNW